MFDLHVLREGYEHIHVVDSAGHRHSHPVLSDHRHVSRAMRVQVRSHVVVADIMSAIRGDFCSHLLCKMLLNDLDRFLFKLKGKARLIM